MLYLIQNTLYAYGQLLMVNCLCLKLERIFSEFVSIYCSCLEDTDLEDTDLEDTDRAACYLLQFHSVFHFHNFSPLFYLSVI